MADLKSGVDVDHYQKASDGPQARLLGFQWPLQAVGPPLTGTKQRCLATAPKTARIAMNVRSFSHPVHVFVGLGFPYEISSVMEACQVLDEWSGSRTSIHAATSTACRSALIGKTDVESARAAFEAFAQAYGILAPDALATGEEQSDRFAVSVN